MSKQDSNSRIYYSIGEVAKMFNVNTSLIRYWEKEFDILKPQKNNKGNRLFTNEDVKNLHIIYHLLKDKGYTIEGARMQLSESFDSLSRETELISTLQRSKAFLERLLEAIRKDGTQGVSAEE